MIHVMNALSYCDRKGFFKVYEEAESAFAKVVLEAKMTKMVVDKLAQDASKEQKAQAHKDHKTAKALVQELKAKMTTNAGGCFLLYENLLSNKAWAKWSKIFSSQTKTAPWTNLNGRTHNTARKKKIQAFEDCITFHLLTIFPKDAAEQQWYYINMSLKKPGKVTIQNFVTQV